MPTLSDLNQTQNRRKYINFENGSHFICSLNLNNSELTVFVAQHLLSSTFGSFRKWQKLSVGSQSIYRPTFKLKKRPSNKTKAFKDGRTKVERTVRVYTKIKLRPNFIFTQH